MVSTTKIVEEVSKTDFNELLLNFKDNILVNRHALDHLSEAQRKIFNENKLMKILTEETPAGIGLQKNGRYAVFFRRKDYYLKFIMEDKKSKLEIITFINIRSTIHFKRLK